MMRPNFPLVLALLALCAPARAYWVRQEWMGFQGETGNFRMRLLDFAAYDSHWGPGVGIAGLELMTGPWDIPRAGRPDASAHALWEFAPLRAYWALVSWKGPPYFHLTESAADRSVGKIELYASYCGWARLTQFNEVTSTILTGQSSREDVDGSLTTRVTDLGIRLDQGLGSSFAATFGVGRRRLDVEAGGPFRARRIDQWYGAASLYFGVTKGSDYGGGAIRFFTDAWDRLSVLFGGSVVHREPLPSTSP